MSTRQNSKALLRLCRASLFLALLCVFGGCSVFIGAVPFSLSIFLVLLIGCLLAPIDAFCVLCAYLLLGALGLPVFAGMRGGVDVLFGMTGGFLLAYPFAAGGLSYFLWSRTKTFMCTLGASLLALSICDTAGALWYACFYADGDLLRAVSVTVLPFVPFDLCKAAFAAWLSLRLRRITP